MKIAATYETGCFFRPVGHTEQFKSYEFGDSRIISSAVTATNGSCH